MEIHLYILPFLIGLLVKLNDATLEEENLSNDPIDDNVYDQIQRINEKNEQLETFEGDIIMSEEDVNKLLNHQDRKRREVVSNKRWIWPNGVVPYTFKSGFPFKEQVKEAMNEVESSSCIRFVPRTNERGYVEFFRGSGCYSMIGYRGRKQQISIGNGCQRKGIIIHEILHALAFFHEQSRTDRDEYVKINWDNIAERHKSNFQKYKNGIAEYFGEKYDKQSLMQYGNYAFAVDRRVMTITSKSDANERFGQRKAMSESDIRQLNRRYSCGVVPTLPATTTTTVDPTCVNKFPYCKRDDIILYCRRYASIRRTCPRACNTCPRHPTTTTTATETTTTQVMITTDSTTTTTTQTTQTTTPMKTTTTQQKTTTTPTKVATTTPTKTTTPKQTTTTPKQTTTIPEQTTTTTEQTTTIPEQTTTTTEQTTTIPEQTTTTTPITTTKTTTAAATTTQSKCRDLMSGCSESWIKSSCGRSSLLKRYCPKTCQSCPNTQTKTTALTTTTEPTCRDYFSYCRNPSVKHACTRFQNIRKSCPKTCNVCSGNTKTTSTTLPTTTRQSTTLIQQTTTPALKTHETTTMATSSSSSTITMQPPTTAEAKTTNPLTTETTTNEVTTEGTTTPQPSTPPTTAKAKTTNPMKTETTTRSSTTQTIIKTTTDDKSPTTRYTEKTTTMTQAICKDKMSCCGELASDGLCKNRLVEMKCKKSCGTCEILSGKSN